MKRFRIGQCVVHRGSRFGPMYVVNQHPDSVLVMGTKDRAQDWHVDDVLPINREDALVLRARRSDGYWHYALVVGRRVHIDAGCRNFFTARAALTHWKARQRQPYAYRGGSNMWPNYYKTSKAAKLRERDSVLNKWSVAFVRKAERVRTRKKA